MRQIDIVVLRTTAILLVATGAAGLVVACTSNDANPDVPSGPDGGGTFGVDATADTAPPPAACAKNEDCASGVCNITAGLCDPPSCTDGVKNALETDTDCGGDCAKCDQLKACKVGADCKDGVCADTGAGLRCQPPTNTDGVKNGNETGTDCGGTGNPKCADGQGCAVRDDCTSDYCKANVCTPTTPADGVQNGNETDVDCGGTGNPRCDDAKKCLLDADCKSDVCKDTGGGQGLRCQVPTPTDGKKNGTETDVDCGGASAPKCVAGKSCVAGNDCKSGGCNYQFKCAAGRSCTARYGGDTCGLGGEGGVGAAQWEDCCKTIAVNTPTGGAVYLDKYQVTAGRMRAFLTAIGYNVRAFVQQARADGKIPTIPVKVDGVTADGVNPVLHSSWDVFLPTSFAGAGGGGELSEGPQSCTGAPVTCNEGAAQAGIYTAIRNHLGGLIFRNNAQTFTGCYVGAPGTHSFRFPDGMQDGATPAQPQDLYDTKSLNCVDYLVAQAFCVWDGGRLETFPEWQAAWGAGATPFSAATAALPAEPTDRCDNTKACTPATVNADCGNPAAPNPPTWSCVSNKCCLAAGDRTYWGCRFPWVTDANQAGGPPATCGLTWPATRTVDYANYKYSYEYPKLLGSDYIVFLSAPGRLKGRGPLGHSDVIGAGFELTSSVDFVAYNPANRDSGPFQARHKWAGNGSWEVHTYNKNYTGNTMLLNKYGKLGLRCVKFASNE